MFGPVDSAVDDELHGQVLPVLREALSNVAQHARATRVEVEVDVDGQDLRLSVLDDGIGLGPVHQLRGLGNARTRAEARGGSLELAPRLPHGLLFRWVVPLRAPAAPTAPTTP
jgi:signal transduction histidine kinase